MNASANSLDGIPVLVLGAGRGQRMGGPKSLMEIQGQPWWVWQDNRLAAYGLAPHWVVSEKVRAAMGEYGRSPTRLVIAEESAPMFASVLAGLASVNDITRGVFVLPVDTPAPRAEHFERIVHMDRPAHPTYLGKGGHPLYLPSQWIQRELGTFLAEAGAVATANAGLDLRLDKLIEGNCNRLETDDPGVVVNMNQPADVQAWLKHQVQS